MSIFMFPTKEYWYDGDWGSSLFGRALNEKKSTVASRRGGRNQSSLRFQASRGVYWRTDASDRGLVGGGCCEARGKLEPATESETALPKERSFQEAMELLMEGVTSKDYTKFLFGLKVIKNIREFPESSLKIYVEFLATYYRNEIPQWILEKIAEFVPMILYKLEKHDLPQVTPMLEELKSKIKKHTLGGPELEFYLEYSLLVISDLQKMGEINPNLEEVLKIGSAFYSGDSIKNAILDPLELKINKYMLSNGMRTQIICRVQMLVLKIINSELLGLEELTQLIEIGSNTDKFTKTLVLYAIRNVLVKSSNEIVFQSSITFVFRMCQDYDVRNVALRICYELCHLLCFKDDLNQFLRDKREQIMNHADLVTKNLLIKEEEISNYLKSFKRHWKVFNGLSRKRLVQILDSFKQEVTGDLKYLELMVSGEDKTLNAKVKEFLDSRVHRVLLITGPLGIGKTTFCKKLVIELQNQEYLPLYLNLVDSDTMAGNLIEEVFKFNKVCPDQEIIKYRTLLFILDDYSCQMGNFIETNNLFERYPNIKLIVTFQSSHSINLNSLMSYENGVPNSDERMIAHINPFSCEDIQKLMENTGNSEMSSLIRSDSCIQDLFSVPMHLSMCLTHPNIMNSFIRAPKRSRSVLYTNYFTERKSMSENTAELPYNNQIFSDYIISQNIKRILEEDVPIEESLLNKTPVSKNTISLILDFLDKDHEKKLLDIVYSSRSRPEIAMAASNALTILNKSNFSFIGKNFSKVQAPYADLSFSNFSRTDFSGSNLRNASFQKSMMTFANFWHCDLMQAELGEWPSLRGHNNSVTAVALSASFIVSASRDKTLKIWDVGTSQNIFTLPEQKGYSRSVAISPNGTVIASGSGDCSIKLWEKNKVKFVLQGHTGYVSALEFSPNGKYLVSGSYDKTVLLWDLAAQKQVYQLKGHSGYIKSLVFAPSGVYIASGGADDAICIWISMTGVQIHKLDSPAGCLKFTPDNKMLISVGADGWLRLWEVASGEMSTEIETEGPVKSLACSTDGRKVITGSPEGLIHIWDFESRRLSKTLAGHSGSVTSLSVYKHMMASGSQDCTIKVWDLSELDDYTETLSHSDSVTSLSASPDGRLIASGSKDCTIKIWNLKKGRLLFTLKGHSDLVHSVCFSPDSKTLASGSSDNTTFIWNLHSRQVQTTLEHSSRSLVFSTERNFLACADRSIKIWDLSVNQMLKEIDGHAEQINSIVYCSNDEFIVSGSADCTIKIWNEDSGSLLRTLNGHSKEVNSVCVTQNLKYVVSGSNDYTVKIWLFETGVLKYSLNINLASVHCVSLSPDDLHLTAAHSDNSVSSWELETGELVKAIRAHTDAINSTVYSTDGRFLVTAGADSSVKVWDLLCEDRSEHIKSIAYSDDGKYIGKFDNDDTWDLETFHSESRSIGSDQSFMNLLSSVKVWEISTGKLVFSSQETNKGTIVFNGEFVGVARHGIVLKAWNYLTGAEADLTQIGSFERKNEEDAHMLYWNSYNESARFYGAKIKGALLSKKDHSLITSRRHSIK